MNTYSNINIIDRITFDSNASYGYSCGGSSGSDEMAELKTKLAELEAKLETKTKVEDAQKARAIQFATSGNRELDI